MKIDDLNHLDLVDLEECIKGGNTAENWYDWLQNIPIFNQNSATASFSAIAIGEDTFTAVEATVIVTENSSYSSVHSVAVASA